MFALFERLCLAKNHKWQKLNLRIVVRFRNSKIIFECTNILELFDNQKNHTILTSVGLNYIRLMQNWD